MKNYFLPLTLFLTTAAHAQTTAFTREEWTAKPVLHPIEEHYSKESAIILLNKTRLEYIDETPQKIIEYRTVHKIIHVSDDKGIESFNKVYLGFTDSTDIVDMRARAILPNGAVADVSRGSIKEVQEEDGNKYKIFAMEGLEKGAEIEYIYTVKHSLDFFGRESLQGRFPVLDAQFEIRCPQRLIFQLKGYNCTIDVGDTSLDTQKAFSTRLRNIPGAANEKYAAYEANLQRVEYRLSYNTANGNEHVRLNTWNLLAQRLYDGYESFTEKELSRAGDMIDANNWQKLSDDRQRIIAVEDYLKKQFTTRNDIDLANAGNIDWMIKNRIASHRGIIRLYAAIFRKLGVDHQVVLTCNRSEKIIDKSFENWDNTNDFLFYFPSTKKFLAPTLVQLRYPWINPFWGATDALYCQATTIGNFTTAIAIIKPVPLEDMTQSFSRTDASLSLSPNLDTALVDLKQTLAGYLATGIRSAYTLANPDQQHEFFKEMAKSGANSEKIVSSKVENAGFDAYSDNKPFVMQVTVHSEGLLESAGKNILVKIGALIGQQTELYQESDRQFPMQLGYPHTLERFIDFTLPEGYTVKNLNDIVIHHEYKVEDETVLGFTSDYKIEGNTLKVHILETYKKTFYPVAQYENFRTVINAAADFNKVTLILEKKG